MKISPNITFRLAKSQWALTAIPVILRLAALAPGLVRQFPKADLIRGRTAVGDRYCSDGISFDEQPSIGGAADFYNLKSISRLGRARRQRTALKQQPDGQPNSCMRRLYVR